MAGPLVSPHPNCRYCNGQATVFPFDAVEAYARKTGVIKPHLLDHIGLDLSNKRGHGVNLTIVLHPNERSPSVQYLAVILDKCNGPYDATHLPTRILMGSDWLEGGYLLGAVDRRDSVETTYRLLAGTYLVWQYGNYWLIPLSPIAHLVVSYHF